MTVNKKQLTIVFISILSLLFIIFAIWQLDIRNWQKLDISKLTDTSISTVIYDNAARPVSSLGAMTIREYTPLVELPDYVPLAFVAAEDARFYTHNGIDIKRIFSAAVSNMRSGSYEQGASTITQQLIKLTHLTSEKTLSRKAQEAWLAIQLERIWTKDQILEAYINTVYFGGGAYGIHAAAQRYFSKPPAELSISEAALLAGIIKSPTNYAPHNNISAAETRRNYVIKAMLEYGCIDSQSASAALASPVVLNESLSASNNSWYTDQVCISACSILSLSMEELIGGGYSIYTCMDSSMQKAAESTMASDAIYPSSDVQGALIAIVPSTGAVAALVGGREYSVQMGLNRASDISRQPGSLIKPISTYAAAVEKHKYLPSSTVYDIQREYESNYMPGNSGSKYHGPVTMRYALSKSLNAATVDLADTVGISELRNFLERFGITPDDSDNNLALALGAMTYGVSPMDMCAAYAALANNGVYNSPFLINSIYDRYGKLVYRHSSAPQPSVSRRSAYIITDILKTAVTDGTASALASLGVPIAAKTGTSGLDNGDTADAWAAAYTPEIAVTVWIGKDTNSNGGMPPSVTGGGYAAPACTLFLQELLPALSGADFAMPPGLCRKLIDTYVLSNHHKCVLAVSSTPSDYSGYEIFDSEAVLDHSDIWNQPPPVTDLTITSAPGSQPSLSFTGTSPYSDYIIIRQCRGSSENIGTITCEYGLEASFTDEQADISQINTYTVIPRHRLLYECGQTLLGTESNPVEYVPAGMLNGISSMLDHTDTAVPESMINPLF